MTTKVMETNTVQGLDQEALGKSVDLRSDTLTRPTPEMRAAMSAAGIMNCDGATVNRTSGRNLSASHITAGAVDPANERWWRTRRIPVGSEGLLESELMPIKVGQGAVGIVCATGTSSVKQGDPLGEGTVEQPLAILPMQVDGQTVGGGH